MTRHAEPIDMRNDNVDTSNEGIAIIVGSHRRQSQSRKVADYVASQLNRCWILDLAEVAIPMWDEDMPPPVVWPPLSRRLQASSAIIMVTPEWSGMVPSALKNLLLMCEENELAHKAGLIISISSGLGGHYPVAELRMCSHKNIRLCYVPDHVIVRNVETVLNAPEMSQSIEDQRIRERLSYALNVFQVYASALAPVRLHPAIDLETYPYGM